MSELRDFQAIVQMIANYKIQKAQIEADATTRINEMEFQKLMQDQRLDAAAAQDVARHEQQMTYQLLTDSRANKRAAKDAYDEKISTLEATGISIDKLVDEERTSKLDELISEFAEIDKKEYSSLIENIDSQTAYYKDNIAIVNSALVGPILKAKQSATAGGVGEFASEHGTDPLIWDVGDLDFEVFKEAYPDLGEQDLEIAQEWFAQNQPFLIDQARKLNVAKVAAESQSQSYKLKNEQILEFERKKRQNKADIFFSTNYQNMSIESQHSSVAVINDNIRILQGEIDQNDDKKPTEAQQTLLDQYTTSVNNIQGNIIKDFAFLIGEESEYSSLVSSGNTNALVAKYYTEFVNMIRQGVGVFVSATQTQAPGDPGAYVSYVNATKEHYDKASPSDQKKIERLARKYFGFGEAVSFAKFHAKANEYYEIYLMKDFESDNQVDEDKDKKDADLLNSINKLIDLQNQLK